MRLREAFGLVALAVVVGGCSSPVAGEAVATDTIGMFDPCAVIGDEDLVKIGVDPATAEVDIADTHIDGFNICKWEGSWFFLRLTSTSHSIQDVKNNSVVRDLREIEVSGQEVLNYRENNDKFDSGCNIAFSAVQSTAMIRVGAKVGEARPETPCVLVERVAQTVVPLLAGR